MGSPTILWNKVIKEVKLKRYAGPYSKPPYEHYIQSPIGLVPKNDGKEMHLIFHLSYPRQEGKKGRKLSVNGNMPKHKCKVKYCDFDMAILRCLEEGVGCKVSKSDMKSAFRNLGLSRRS